MQFLEDNLLVAGSWHHTWKLDKARVPAFLDDLAGIITSYIHLQEVTSNTDYLNKAYQITEYVLDNYFDAASGLFYFTPVFQKDVVIRKKELYDAAVPSGNSMMAFNLFYLSVVFEKSDWRTLSENMIEPIGRLIIRYPTSFGNWAVVLQTMIYGIKEIVIIGENYKQMLKSLLQQYIPTKIIQASENLNEKYALFKGKKIDNQKTQIFICKNYACKQPVFTVKDALILIKD